MAGQVSGGAAVLRRPSVRLCSSGIARPADLKRLPPEQLPALAAEIRDFLVDRVSRTGGHLGPNLGVVELTIALHRVFDSPRDRIVWDTGHQSYVHKILTGRQDDFDTLRPDGRPVRLPEPGRVRARRRRELPRLHRAVLRRRAGQGLRDPGRVDRTVVAVVGDGALTGGMCWEALNNIAAAKDRPLVIVVNDNGRSYAPTVGGLADHLASLRLKPQLRAGARRGQARRCPARPLVGAPLYEALHGVKKGLKDLLQPQVHVRGPRPQVRRTDRRPRRRRARAGLPCRARRSAARSSCTA